MLRATALILFSLLDDVSVCVYFRKHLRHDIKAEEVCTYINLVIHKI